MLLTSKDCLSINTIYAEEEILFTKLWAYLTDIILKFKHNVGLVYDNNR